jgi:hypothetical protein
MAGLVAWVRVTEKRRLRVIEVDADVAANERLVRALRVSTIPSLVLLVGRRVVGRIDGRATGRQIDRLIRPHLT